MKKEEIQFYSDPDDFVSGDNKYPCDTEYMVYNPMLHRYFLTPEGLLHHGINAERNYISDNPNKVTELIEKTSKKVYDYIQYKSGMQCYQTQMYRIAAAPKTIYPDQYFMRKQFEEALVDQARFMCEIGDSARYSYSETEKKATEQNAELRDISDISPECIRTLETLGLTRWFQLSQFARLDLNKY